MQLNNNGDYNSTILQIFDCSWISRFNGEDERLFMGGLYRIRIESIIDIDANKNYVTYFRALYLLDCMLSGANMAEAEGVKNKDYKVIRSLMQDAGRVEEYVVNTFHLFCYRKEQMIVNLFNTEAKGGRLASLLYETDADGKVGLKRTVFALFRNVRRVVIYVGQHHKEYRVDISTLLPLFADSARLEVVKLKAHHPSWLYRDSVSVNDEAFACTLAMEEDYYGKQEDCLCIVKK